MNGVKEVFLFCHHGYDLCYWLVAVNHHNGAFVLRDRLWQSRSYEDIKELAVSLIGRQFARRDCMMILLPEEWEKLEVIS